MPGGYIGQLISSNNITLPILNKSRTMINLYSLLQGFRVDHIVCLIVGYEYAQFGCIANPRGSHIKLAMVEHWTKRFMPMALNVWHCAVVDGHTQCCILHDLQFVNAGRGCKRRPYGRGILQSRSHDCLICSHECLLLFTPILGLVSVWAARSFDQTALRPSVIKRIRQIDVKYITHITSFGVTA